MGKIYAIANQKGGVGKTTTTLNLGAALQELEKRVLLVDMDPQASLTLCLGVNPDELETTIYNALISTVHEGGASLAQNNLIIKTRSNMDLIPANIELSQADLDLIREPLGIYALRDTLAEAKEAYDYILIDCPPNLGILCTNALAASDEVLIPLQADWLALKGVNLLFQSIGKIQKRANRGLHIAGILLTMADVRTSHTREIISSTREAFAGRINVFNSIIKLSVRLKESPITGTSVLAYAGDTVGAKAYRELAQEVIQ